MSAVSIRATSRPTRAAIDAGAWTRQIVRAMKPAVSTSSSVMLHYECRSPSPVGRGHPNAGVQGRSAAAAVKHLDSAPAPSAAWHGGGRQRNVRLPARHSAHAGTRRGATPRATGAVHQRTLQAMGVQIPFPTRPKPKGAGAMSGAEQMGALRPAGLATRVDSLVAARCNAFRRNPV